MKTIHKTILILLLGIFISPLAGLAQKGKKKPGEKIVAHRVLVKTSFVIHHAYKKVKENKVYTGNLARAVRHQKYARMLYRQGKFFRAMHQSRRARYFAILAIQANKGDETADMKYSKEDEAQMSKGAPSDADLDKEADAALPNDSNKDEDMMAADPDVDVSDGE